MLFPALEEKLDRAKRALGEATPENITEQCKRYLALLNQYRGELYKLPGTPSINLWPREAFRVAIENNTQERHRVAELLLSFTALSGYEAVETLNRLKFKGRDDWVLSAGGASYGGGEGALSIQELVEAASLLRRQEHAHGSPVSVDSATQ